MQNFDRLTPVGSKDINDLMEYRKLGTPAELTKALGLLEVKLKETSTNKEAVEVGTRVIRLFNENHFVNINRYKHGSRDITVTAEIHTSEDFTPNSNQLLPALKKALREY
jgi:hypothetical protein